MDHLGHGLALDHPIFNDSARDLASRLDRAEATQDSTKDLTSPLYPEGRPRHGTASRLFEKDKPKGWNPTIVSHEGFFTDIPGFENLAEGNSEKMLGSLALARQGTYFYWGYSIDPEHLTDGAQKTLLNVLHYMRGKRGSRTVPFVTKTRRILWVYSILGRDKNYQRGVKEHFPGSLVESSRAGYEPSFEGATMWVEKYLPYVFGGRGDRHRNGRYQAFEIDRDALALKTPNNTQASLEKWIELATSGSGEDRDRALRCLKRYVHADIFPPDGDWDAWYSKQKDRIAFIDSTGFWWQVSPVVLEREAADRK